MLVYPQLNTGALSQFPTVKRRQFRTIVNTAADGSTIKLSDGGVDFVEWRLDYHGLSDEELASFIQFHAAVEGTLMDFTFLDPTANILASSGDLNNPFWDKDPFITTSAGAVDPQGTTAAWRLGNNGSGPQSLSQTLASPAEYVYCFSIYAKAETPISIGLHIGDSSSQQLVGSTWRRLTQTSNAAGSTSVAFSIDLPPGAEIYLYGPQAEPQPSPSPYKTSGRSGCYEGARFRDDSFSFTTTGPNSHNTTIKIIHATHL